MKKIVQSLLFSALALVVIVACSEDEPPVAPAKFNIDLTSKDFGSVEVEKTATQTFKISNTGGQDLELKSFTLTGANKDEFSTNAVKTNVKSGKDYSFTVNFAPTAEGNKTAIVSIATNVGVKTVTLKGKAAPKPKAMFSITPSSKDFGDVEVNKTANQLFTITNTGNASLEITGYSITGTNATEFLTGDDAPSTPFTIAAGETKDMTIIFKPTAIGSKSATLKFTTNIGEQTVSLVGNVTAQPVAAFSMNPTSKDFGDVEVNQTANHTFVITNTGNANLEITGYSVIGTNANQFSVNSAPAAPFTIAANGTKNIPVVFRPTTTGSKSATLKFTTNIGDQTVSLTGNATQPATACSTAVNIPDTNFKNALLAHGATAPVNGVQPITGRGISVIDTDGDGKICVTEAQAYTGIINVNSKNISNLTGIEAFTALTQLYCYNNPLSSLDVSNNTALTKLLCYDNSLSSLDVSNNTALTELNCHNNSLSSLDLSNNTALALLNCNSNSLSSLDLSNSTALTWFYCRNNSLSSLDVSNNTSLIRLYCDNNSLSSLDVSNNTALTHLGCNNNSLSSLDVSNSTALTILVCNNNSLTSLNVANGNNGASYPKLYFVHADNNANLTCIQHDTGFDPTTNSNWKKDSTANWSTNCSSGGNTSCATPVNIPDANFKAALLAINGIDSNQDGIICTDEASAYTGRINVERKGISDLTGIEAFTKITVLDILGNQLTSLDVSANTALQQLDCSGNQLTSLDVSANTSLELLYCNATQLTSLDVSANTALIELRCAYNELTSLDVSANTALGALSCSNNQLTSLDFSANTALQRLDCSGNKLTSLDFSANTALQRLDCNSNQLTSLNVSTNAALEGLICDANKLVSLNVSGATALQTLRCSKNQLTNLNVSTNTAVTWLDCGENNLTSLDVSANTALRQLETDKNQLTSLNVANGNNGNLAIMYAVGNTNLTCIQHDTGFDPTTNTNWRKDNNANWSTNCQ